MNYFKFSLGIFLVLAASRFIPHPPNFTSLIALSFYIPLFLGKIFISTLILSFLITDYFIGFHNLTFFTWGSVLIIGLISNFFGKNLYYRVGGVLISCIIFFVITNFGVWLLGSYGYTLNGLISCFVLAIPFFGYTIISSILYSTLIEIIYKFNFIKRTINNYKIS